MLSWHFPQPRELELVSGLMSKEEGGFSTMVRKVAVVCNDGKIRLIEENIPEVSPGMVRIRVYNSLVSPGTELGGWKKLFSKRSDTDDGERRKFGYSNTGIVDKVGEGVTQFKVGDRVAAIGYGFALHSNWAVVPQNLCVALPWDVTFEQGTYAMLLATALQAVRRGLPEIGEKACVVGMGLVGQLTAQLLEASGCRVIGWARNEMQVRIAKTWGISEIINMKVCDPVEQTKKFTAGRGLDQSVFSFPGKAGETWKKTLQCMKITPDGHLMGRIVVVGGSKIDLEWIPANLDVRIAARTGAGYHDTVWELGKDYPPVFMQWTTRTNLEVCMELIRYNKVNVDSLTTHCIDLYNVETQIDALKNPEEILGLIFKNGGTE